MERGHTNSNHLGGFIPKSIHSGCHIGTTCELATHFWASDTIEHCIGSMAAKCGIFNHVRYTFLQRCFWNIYKCWKIKLVKRASLFALAPWIQWHLTAHCSSNRHLPAVAVAQVLTSINIPPPFGITHAVGKRKEQQQSKTSITSLNNHIFKLRVPVFKGSTWFNCGHWDYEDYEAKNKLCQDPHPWCILAQERWSFWTQTQLTRLEGCWLCLLDLAPSNITQVAFQVVSRCF